MKPILFTSTAQTFTTHGIGTLSDAISCLVTEERNGEYELTLVYPVSGIHYASIGQRSILLAKPNPTSDNQAFRVYRITKPLNGQVTIYARHISYDLSGVIVTPFEAESASSAMQALATYTVGSSPFTYWTDNTTVADMTLAKPCSIRSILGGSTGSILDIYGGEYEWDNFTMKLHARRGQNRGVSIRYGKNLTDLKQEENCANCYTAVFPFWSKDNMVIKPTEPVSAGTFDYTKVMVLDCTQDFESSVPTVAQLQARAQEYIDANQIGVPTVSLEVSFVQLEQTEEYKGQALLERVSLCDTVNVVFDKLGVSATSKVVKTVYNCLLERYESVGLGDSRTNIADTIAAQRTNIDAAPQKAVTMLGSAIEDATKRITGNLGGYVVFHSSTGATEPDEILIMNTNSIDTATKVWRWNCSGLGYSNNGYNGPYRLAMTVDGQFVADFITTGTLSANMVTACAITTGFIQNSGGTFKIDLTNGKLTIHGTQTYTQSQYTSADQQRCAKITIGSVIPTAADIAKYDLTGDGCVTITDVVRVGSFVQGTYSTLQINWTITLSAESGLKVEKETILDDDNLGTVTVLTTAAGGVETKSMIASYGTIENFFTEDIRVNGSLCGPQENNTSVWSVCSNGIGAFTGLKINGEYVPTQTLLGYLVMGKPSGGSISTCFVPIDYCGSSYKYQLADEAFYISFNVYADGTYNVVKASSSAYSFGPVVPIYNY